VEMSSSATAAGEAPPQHERVIPHSGTLSKKPRARNSARFVEVAPAPSSAANDDVEITLDVRDGSVAMLSVEPAHAGPAGDDPSMTLLPRPLENNHRRSPSYGHSLIRNASSRIMQASQELRRLGSSSRRGAAGPRTDTDLSKSAAAHALKGLKFISKAQGTAGWEAVETRFHVLAESGLLHRSKFGECIGGANKLSKITEQQAAEYALLIMEELDPGNLGYIDVHNLETLLLQAPSSQSVSIGTGAKDMSQMLSQSLRPTPEPNPLRRWRRRAQYFLEDNWRRVWVVLLWLCVCVGLFAWKFAQYRRRYVFQVMGYCVCVAKGGAETLKFNMALILLPVCRNTITWVRNHTGVGRVVPLDDNISFHMVVAAGIAVGAGLHVVSHLTCDFPRLLRATDAMLVLMAVAFTLAMPWFRRGELALPGPLKRLTDKLKLTDPLKRLTGQLKRLTAGPLKRLTGFNAFWYTHHCFVVVYALLLVHGHYLYLTHKWYKKSTWMYLAVPMVLYACERLTRALRSRVRAVKILKVGLHPGKVMSLCFSKPPGFRYRSGQYIFVNCAAVSPFEW
jgi:hypothetical protein